MSGSDGFRLERQWLLHAPCDLVFRMLTAPDALPKWWGPMGFAMPEIALDLRVGGRYRFGMKPPEGDLFHITGQYLEIHAPTRLVFTFEYDEPDPDEAVQNIGAIDAIHVVALYERERAR